jgi:glycosyltransferase involved in cell wall biosynthesis
MKILLVNHYALPPTQPGGTRHHLLAKGLIALGHQPTIVASGFDHVTRADRLEPGERCRRERHAGVPFLWLRTPAYQGNATAARYWNMRAFGRAVERLGTMLEAKPDVVVGSSPHLFGARAALRLARGLQVPFVLELRDVWPQSLVDVMGIPRWHPVIWLMSRIERELYRSSSHLITLLPGVGPRVAALGGDPDAMTWISNGIDLSLVPPVRPPEERELFTFMYAGAHGRTNALDILLDAAARLQARQDRLPRRFQLVLLGTGPEKPKLQARAETLGLRCVSFLPPVPKREVYGTLAGADAFCVSGRRSPLWDHGISFNKLYDFMAMARPTVIGLDAPGNPIAQSGGGIVVDSGDPEAMAAGMERLLTMAPGARWELARRAREHVEAHCDSRVLARRLEQALLTALAAAPRIGTWRTHAS